MTGHSKQRDCYVQSQRHDRACLAWACGGQREWRHEVSSLDQPGTSLRVSSVYQVLLSPLYLPWVNVDTVFFFCLIYCMYPSVDSMHCGAWGWVGARVCIHLFHHYLSK